MSVDTNLNSSLLPKSLLDSWDVEWHGVAIIFKSPASPPGLRTNPCDLGLVHIQMTASQSDPLELHWMGGGFELASA